MARNLKQLAASSDKSMMDAVCSSAHQIWQAGLGAFAIPPATWLRAFRPAWPN